MSTGDELRLGKFGNQGSIDTTKLSTGGVREENVSEEFKSIFKKFDTDGNHVLTDSEIQQVKEQVNTYAAHRKNSIFSQKEADKMLQEKGIENTQSETFFKFLKELAQAKKDNNGDVISSSVDENGNAVIVSQQGNKQIKTTYDKDSQKPSVQVITEGDTEETYTYIDGKPVLTKKVENKGKSNEKITTITVDSNGNLIKTSVLEKNANGTIETITEGDKKTVIESNSEGSTETVTEGNNTSITNKDKNGKITKQVVVENSNDVTKYKKTTTTYNDKGRIEEIEDISGKTVIEYTGNKKITTKNGVRTEETYTNEGSTEVITKEGSTTRTVNTKNKAGNRLTSTKTVNEKEYSLKYDGEGNIVDVVVQFGENIDAICKKFGCTREELIEANKDVVKTKKNGQKYFAVGAKIKVPDKNYKIEADAKFLQGRKTSEQAIAQFQAWKAQRAAEDAEAAEREKSDAITFIENKYNTFEEMAIAHFKQDGVENPTKRQIQLRVEMYKKLNPDLRDGEIKGHKVVVKYNASTTSGILDRQEQRQIVGEQAEHARAEQKEMTDGKSIAQHLYHSVDDNVGGLTEDEFLNAMNNVTPKNIIGVIEQYKIVSPDEGLFEAIFDETYHTLGTRRQTAKKLIDALVQRANSAELDERGRQAVNDCVNELNSYWSLGIGVCDTAKLESLVDNLIGAIHAAESITKTERLRDNSGNGISETLSLMGEQYQNNTDALEDQLAKDGWCADLYEGLKWCVGSDNLDEKVKADLEQYKGFITQLENAEKEGGEAGFKAKFKEIFGVEYDPKLIKGYNRMQQNFAMAQATTMAKDGFYNEFVNVLAFSGDYEGDYNVLHRQYADYLKQSGQGQIQDGNAAADNAIKIELQKEGIDFAKATAQDKKKALGRIIKNTYAQMQAEVNKYTNGKSLEQMKKQVDSASSAVFGTKHDIAFRVNDYIASQQQGGAVVNMAFKAGAAIAIAVATGGAGVPALLGAAALTTAASATIDLTDRVSSDVGLQEGEVLQILKNATVDGASVFAGGMVGKYAMMFKNANSFVQAGGRLTTQLVGDVATGAAAEYVQNGTITLEGVMFNAVFSAAGNLVSLKALGKVDKPNPNPTPKVDSTPTPKLDAISKDAKPRTVYVKTKEKFAAIKEEVDAKLKTITSEADLDALKQQVDVIQNRDMRRELEHMIEAKRAEIKKAVVEPKPEPAPEPKPEPAPEPKPEPAPEPKPIDDPTVEIVNNKTIFNNLSEGLKKAWQNIEDAISTMTTIADFHAIKSNISNYFSGKADAFNALMTKLNSKVKQLGLNVGHNGGQQIADIKPSVHNKLAKGHSYEIDQNVHFKAGDDVYSFDDFSPELRERINNLKDGESLKIGRNDIDQYNDLISREHLIVKKENGKLHIEDISTNGTMILDEANAKAFKSLQELKRSNHKMNTPEYLANEAKFLEAVGNDYDLLNKLVTSNVIDLNSHSFTNIMTSTNANNKVILEQFLNNPQSIQSGNRFSSAQINQEDLSLLMLFNRNNSNATSLVSSPSQVKDFLTNAKKELNNLRQVYASDPINGNLSNSEIADAIQFGKTRMSDGTIVEVTPNTNILDDIENLIHGKDYIQHFSKNDNLTNIFAKTQTGDVASVNGQMFVNDGTQMVRLSLSENTFRELFPPVQRFSMHQGAIGTCYLDSSINILANSRKGRSKLYQMIGEETINGEKKLYTTTANGNGKKEYFNRFTRSGKNLRDRNGLAIIEQGYCMNSRRHALDHRNVTRIMMANDGGFGFEALGGLTGDRAISITDPAIIREKIMNLAGRDDCFLWAGTKNVNGLGHNVALDPFHDIHQTHAYTVTGYNPATNTVSVSNPWHSGVSTELSMDEFLRNFQCIDLAQIM